MEKTKEINAAICRNFLAALARLASDKVIRGKATFCKRYGINRLNFYQLEQNPSRSIFQPCWLYALATDYKVSPTFLLTGQGDFYQPQWDAEKVKKLQTACKKNTPTPKPTENQSDAE